EAEALHPASCFTPRATTTNAIERRSPLSWELPGWYAKPWVPSYLPSTCCTYLSRAILILVCFLNNAVNLRECGSPNWRRAFVRSCRASLMNCLLRLSWPSTSPRRFHTCVHLSTG